MSFLTFDEGICHEKRYKECSFYSGVTSGGDYYFFAMGDFQRLLFGYKRMFAQ